MEITFIRLRDLLPLFLLLVLLHGCSTLGPARNVEGKVPLNKAVTELSEDAAAGCLGGAVRSGQASGR